MAKRRFRAEDLYRLKSVTDVELSPDSRRVAFVVVQADEEEDRLSSSIWVVPTDGSDAPRQFSEGPGDTCPRWSPDGRSLAYVSAPPGAPLKAHVRLAPLDGGAPRRLGTMAGPVSQLAWAPDSGRLAVVCRTGLPSSESPSAKERNEPRLVRGLAARFNGLGWKDGRTHIFLLEVQDGSARQLTTGDYDHADPSFSPDGTKLAFVSDRQAGRDDREWHWDLWVSPLSGGRPRRLSETRGNAASPSFSPDGKLIAFAGTDTEVWESDNHIFVVPADGSAKPERVAPLTDRDVAARLPGMPAPYRWSRDRELMMLLLDRGGVALHRARLGDAVTSEVVGGNREIDFFALRPGGRSVAFASAWVDQPWEVYALTSDRAKPKQISHLHDDFLEEVELARVKRSSVRREDGTEIEYFTLLPTAGASARRGGEPAGRSEGPPNRRPPVHLGIHGGPHGWHPLAWGLALHQTIAAAGFTVLLPNPRGSTGYGKDFKAGCNGDWGGADCDDILACCDDVVARALGDGDRLFVSGYSYGGFMTAWIVGHHHRFRAATSVAPVIDQQSMALTTDVPHFSLYSMGGTPWERSPEYEKRSPLTYLPEVTTPVLCVCWEGDLRTPIAQTEELYAGLRLLGKEAQQVRYPGGAHGIHAPSQNIDWVKRIIDWNKQHDRSPARRGRSRTAR